MFLSPAAARWLDVAAGDTVRVQVALAEVPLRVAGELGAAGNQRFAVMDIAGAQAAFDRVGSLSRIDLRLKPGVDVAAFAERLRTTLPPGLAVLRPETAIAAGASLSRSYRINLNVLALVALFTGGLLVFSTQAHSVVRRRAQFALLRVLGVTRRRLVAMIVAEGAVIGVAGSALGLALGFALAQIAVRWVGADLGSGYFRGVVPTLAIEPVAFGLFFIARHRRCRGGQLRAGAGDGARIARAGAEGGRRGARLRAPAARRAGPGRDGAGRGRDRTAAGGGVCRCSVMARSPCCWSAR